MRHQTDTTMRKYVLIFGLLAVMFSFSGCYVHESSEPCKFHKKTIDLMVQPENWVYDDVSNQYFASFNVPDITQAVYDYGEVSVSREFETGTKKAYQVALPMTSYIEETLTDGSIAYYIEHIDYRVGVGFIDIQLTTNDHFYAEGQLVGMYFRVQLTY